MQTYIIDTEQNNDHVQIMHNIQFRSSFKEDKEEILIEVRLELYSP